MIRISLGNVGSGKTVSEVREMFLNKAKRKTYSNIKTKLKHQIDINPKYIIKEEIVGEKKKKDGTLEPVTKHTLNMDYWKSLKEPINVVIDEAHSIVNARRSQSKINVIVTDWIALIRRILGNSDSGYGELVFITQLPNRIDVIAREMATQIRYHVMHYYKFCKKCQAKWQESSEIPEPLHSCPVCASWKIHKYNHNVEVWKFQDMNAFIQWKEFGAQTFFSHYMISDIEKYFPLYDTLQWDNMFSDFY